jgi:hypothetical protein
MKTEYKLRINFYRKDHSDSFAFNMIAEDDEHVKQIMAVMSNLPPNSLQWAHVFRQHGILVLQTWHCRDGVWEDK